MHKKNVLRRLPALLLAAALLLPILSACCKTDPAIVFKLCSVRLMMIKTIK